MKGGSSSRRDALKFFAAGAAALVSGCEPARGIVPYREMPEGMVPGRPLFFATSLPLAGPGRGVLVESHQGRPTKIHGNPRHPASLGGTDVFAEAAVLDLFDPARSPAPLRKALPTSWSELAQALLAAARKEGAVLLTGPVASPTMARQIRQLKVARPGLRWFSYQKVPPALQLQGRQLWPDFTQLDAVLCLNADILGPGPGQIAFAKAWSRARRDRRDVFRSYVFEAGPSLTGAQADRRVPLRPSQIAAVPDAVLAALKGQRPPEGPVRDAADLVLAAKGRAAVFAGPSLPDRAQTAVTRINEAIAAPLRYLPPFNAWEGLAPEPVSRLLADMDQGRVPALIVLGVNPAYELGEAFSAAMAAVPERISFGTQVDETAAAAEWHGPLHHPLEEWSDLRAFEGTVGLVQPLIAPLHDSRSAHEVLAMMQDPAPAQAYGILRDTWREAWSKGEGADEDFEARWVQSLHDGVIEGSGALRMPAPADRVDQEKDDRSLLEHDAMEVVLRPSPTLLDGSFATNAWLQECPEPITKQVWGNSVWLAPEDAAGIRDGDLVELTSAKGNALLPALVVEGQAAGSVTLHLGYGRERAGPIGSAVGTCVQGLGPFVTLRRTSGQTRLARLQSDFSQHGRELLQIAGRVAPERMQPQPSFYPAHDYADYAWGMVIDSDACIGCNACLIACQSENNIPVVGPDEVRRKRNMHWIRIDAYELREGRYGFQPVPCMHCELAPCEPVCPVEASVHDSEGLNVQVYNRCIGTRFCQANCPYKVRRFNFFDYAEKAAFENQASDLLQALRNPDVSVRSRGVMEKCTYCVQRISAARRDAKKENRRITDGEVITACQAACPADAIHFGDLNDPTSAVSRARSDPRHYNLLEELNTRPRTSYLARVLPEDGA